MSTLKYYCVETESIDDAKIAIKREILTEKIKA